jgi:hypothetical protein
MCSTPPCGLVLLLLTSCCFLPWCTDAHRVPPPECLPQKTFSPWSSIYTPPPPVSVLAIICIILLAMIYVRPPSLHSDAFTLIHCVFRPPLSCLESSHCCPSHGPLDTSTAWSCYQRPDMPPPSPPHGPYIYPKSTSSSSLAKLPLSPPSRDISLTCRLLVD